MTAPALPPPLSDARRAELLESAVPTLDERDLALAMERLENECAIQAQYHPDDADELERDIRTVLAALRKCEQQLQRAREEGRDCDEYTAEIVRQLNESTAISSSRFGSLQRTRAIADKQHAELIGLRAQLAELRREREQALRRTVRDGRITFLSSNLDNQTVLIIPEDKP